MHNKYFDLFFTFAKIGLFTFGGGYAMIPLIQREAAQNKKWVSEQDILHCFFNACYERLDDTEKALYWQQMLDRSEERTVI